MLVSAIHQLESVVGIPVSPLSRTSLPLPIPSHLSRLSQRTCLSFLHHTANSHWLSILHMAVYMLEKGMATYSSILAWRIPWSEDPVRLQSIALQSWTRLKQLSICFHATLSICPTLSNGKFLVIHLLFVALKHSGAPEEEFG